MKAKPPARVLAWLVDVLDRFWGLIGLAVCLALVALVFAPRGMFAWMIGAGCVGTAMVVVWIGGGARWRPR
jgi:energy-coupling factor transporter transmembrane protein EcfT